MTENTLLDFRDAYSLTEEQILFEMLQKDWNGFAPVDIEQFLARLDNSRGAIRAGYNGDLPACIVEALMTDTHGDPYKIADDYQKLTGDGTWLTHRPSGDTALLVDLTVDQRWRGMGFADQMIEYCRRAFIEYPHMLTFSPDNGIAQKMHEKHGARAVRTIENARPGHKYPDVIVMQYR